MDGRLLSWREDSGAADRRRELMSLEHVFDVARDVLDELRDHEEL